MPSKTSPSGTLVPQYQSQQFLPPNFSDVLKEYAREVLRNQPADILEWSAAYFKALALETDPLQAKEPPADHYTPVVEDPGRAMLANKMVKVFSTVDTSDSGQLPVQAVRRVLSEGLELTEPQVLYVLSAPFTEILHEDGQDQIDYHVFAYAAVRTVQYMQQQHPSFEAENGADAEATVHGMTRADVEQGFLRIFRLLDEGDTGRLRYHDFTSALENAPYRLTARDIRVLCLECEPCMPEDEEFGENALATEVEVEYERELPHMFDRLRLAEAFALFEEERLC